MKDSAGRKRKAEPAEVSCRLEKRSANEISSRTKPAVGRLDASSDAPARADEIPAAVWGHVMDYLPYTDVLQCLLVNRLLSFEASAFVDELHIFKSCEVNQEFFTTNRRRFQNVSEISIMCLLSKVSHWSSENPKHTLNVDMIDKIVPFLQTFPKLAICWFGGWDEKLLRYQNYDEEQCVGPEDHAEQYRRLLEHLLKAFDERTLPQALVFDDFEIVCSDNTADCEFCERICATFPLPTILTLHYANDGTCFYDEELSEKIKGRNWSTACLRKASSAYFSCMTLGMWRVTSGKSCKADLEKRGADDSNHVYYLSKKKRDRIQLMLDIGISIDAWEPPTKEAVLTQMRYDYSIEDRGYAIAKSSFDFLVRAGYPLDAGDFVIVDESLDEELQQRIANETHHDDENDADEMGGDEGDIS